MGDVLNNLVVDDPTRRDVRPADVVKSCLARLLASGNEITPSSFTRALEERGLRLKGAVADSIPEQVEALAAPAIDPVMSFQNGLAKIIEENSFDPRPLKRAIEEHIYRNRSVVPEEVLQKLPESEVVTKAMEQLFEESIRCTPNRVVKKGSVVSILRVLTKRGGDDEKTAGVSAEIR